MLGDGGDPIEENGIKGESGQPAQEKGLAVFPLVKYVQERNQRYPAQEREAEFRKGQGCQHPTEEGQQHIAKMDFSGFHWEMRLTSREGLAFFNNDKNIVA